MLGKLVNVLLLGATLSLTVFSQDSRAEFIPVENWHVTTDGFAGLKQHDFIDSVYYAVSVGGRWSSTAEYEAIDGYHFATRDEYMNLYNLADKTGLPDTRHYRGQGGWNDYIWEGVQRVLFRFADTTVEKSVIHASHGVISNPYYNYSSADAYGSNAGFIMIKEPVSYDVSLPGGLPVLSMLLMGGLFVRRKGR